MLYKHSRPYHPQTCGKVERWHRTLKGFLAKRPAATLGELQLVLDDVVRYYNEVRPHRGIDRRTPIVAYNARATAKPHTLIHQPHWRIRTDTVDVRGHVTLRYLGKLRHLNVGWSYRGHSIRLYILDTSSRSRMKTVSSLVKRESTPTATTNQRVKASDSLHRFSCSR